MVLRSYHSVVLAVVLASFIACARALESNKDFLPVTPSDAEETVNIKLSEWSEAEKSVDRELYWSGSSSGSSSYSSGKSGSGLMRCCRMVGRIDRYLSRS